MSISDPLDATVAAHAAPIATSLPAISKHRRVPEAAGLIVGGRNARLRPWNMNARPRAEIAHWSEHDRHIGDVLDQVLQQVKDKTDD